MDSSAITHMWAAMHQDKYTPNKGWRQWINNEVTGTSCKTVIYKKPEGDSKVKDCDLKSEHNESTQINLTLCF